MAYIQWSPEHELGIAPIDEQHRRIVDLINELETARETGDAGCAKHVLEGLLDYSITHFRFEEELLERAGYPFVRAHRRVHEIFTRRVRGFHTRAEHGENVTAELLPMLKVWLSTHIMGDDRDYAATLRKVSNAHDEDHAGWLGATLKRLFA